jgi:pimeloyl-ACP methyl ester carboxylesterase
MPRRGFRFVAELKNAEPVEESDSEQKQLPDGAPKDGLPAIAHRQTVKFCASRDGTQLAFATTGNGIPLVRAGHWLTHLEHDWRSPVWRPFLDELGKHFQVTRYDQRGNGLSDWSVSDFGFDKFVDDLEAVIEAAGLETFALYGASQGVPISVAYAVRNPERVSHLILHGGYARGRLVRGSIEEKEQGEALLTLIRHGWGKPGSPFLQAFSSMYIPGGTPEQIESLVELQRRTTTPENAAKIRATVDSFDVTHLVESITVPTLVVHARNDGVQPLEAGRKLATGIENSEFLMLESANHVILEHEPAWGVLFSGIESFILD